MATKSPKTTPPTATNGVNEQAEHIKEQAYKQFDEALNRMRAEVKQMQTKLKEYDDKYQASNYLTSSLEEIKASLDSLSKQARDFSSESLATLWNKFNEAVEKFRKVVLDFEQKHQLRSKISEISQPFVEKFKGIGDSVTQIGKNSRNYVINAAAEIDKRYSLETKFTSLDEKYKLSETAKNLQQKGEDFIEKQKLKEKVMNLDERFTGSKAGEYLHLGVDKVKEELGKLQQDYETAKSK